MRFVTPMFIAGFLATACGTQHKDNSSPAAPVAPMSADQAAKADKSKTAAVADKACAWQTLSARSYSLSRIRNKKLQPK